MRKFGLSIVLLVTALALASCDRNQPLENVQNASFKASQNATLDQMTDAIVTAGTARGWTMTPQDPGNVRGDILVRGKHKVVVDVLYDAEKFSIVYVASDGMNYQLRNGQPRIHPSYMKWIKYLRQDIQKRTDDL